MTVEKLCHGKYDRALRSDRGCWTCKSAGACIPPTEELTMAGGAQKPARSKSRDQDLNDILVSAQRAKELG